ncbi:MAG: ankyrin repeat domain-containing protein [Acidobacteria bacterium]|nr:ankyrin repeat domain-containing protein [Acidobacteriota bacterium]
MHPTRLALCLTMVLAVTGVAAAQGDLRLVTAVKNGDTAGARALLRQRIDVRARDAEGMTALHWAAHWNDQELVGLLVAAGADVNGANRYGVRPLHEASTVASLPIIEALLKAGADPNAVYGEGETPLMTAARAGSVAAVRLLLAHGASVNAREAWRGQSALMYATVENHTEVARALIESGADVNARSITVNFEPVTTGGGGVTLDRHMGGLTSLMFAARQGALEVAEALIDAGAAMDLTEPQYSLTAMQIALFNGHYRFATMLIERGVQVNDGALYMAVEMRNLATYNNRPNPPEVDGDVDALDVITLLLERGANPNLPMAKRIPPRQAQGAIAVPAGATPLYRATRATDLATVRLLLDHGADPGQPARDGSTPLMVASGFGVRARAADDEFTEAGPRADPLDAIKLFVEKGADVNAVNALGNTALHYAATLGSERMIRYLVGAGASLDIKNKQERLPIDLTSGEIWNLLFELSEQRFRTPQAAPVQQ